MRYARARARRGERGDKRALISDVRAHQRRFIICFAEFLSVFQMSRNVTITICGRTFLLRDLRDINLFFFFSFPQSRDITLVPRSKGRKREKITTRLNTIKNEFYQCPMLRVIVKRDR